MSVIWPATSTIQDAKTEELKLKARLGRLLGTYLNI